MTYNNYYEFPSTAERWETDSRAITMLHEQHAGEYAEMTTPSTRRPAYCRIVAVVAAVSACSTLILSSYSPTTQFLLQQPFVALRNAAPIPHVGEWCSGSGAKVYTKTTLKRIVDRAIYGLLTYDSTVGETKFEASDVARVNRTFYVVCDSSWSVLRLDEDLPMLSSTNELVGPRRETFTPPEDEDSGFEAIMHDKSSGDANDFYIVRESIEHSSATSPTGSTYNAQILKVHFEDASARRAHYSVDEVCHSQFQFEGDSKGFEGAVSLRGRDGVLYILGLCEGNFCSEARGKEVGNGRVVVMRRVGDDEAPGGCVWQTVRVLELPSSVGFVDYSAMAVHHSTSSVAITSQENSQLWVGKLDGGYDGAFDPATAAFTEGRVYDFPRTAGASCEVQYCNIEGIHWVSGGELDGSSPQTLVAVSDKMKAKGRQPATCQDKDQSVHLFQLP